MQVVKVVISPVSLAREAISPAPVTMQVKVTPPKGETEGASVPAIMQVKVTPPKGETEGASVLVPLVTLPRVHPDPVCVPVQALTTPMLSIA
jgi:hypothetical protein